MTLQQAKSLVTEKDYVIHLNDICLFLGCETNDSGRIRIQPLRAKGYRIPLASACQTMSDYRGCFDSSVLPPISKEDKLYSIDVFTFDGDLYNVGFYSYEERKWCWHTDTLVEQKDFVWCFPPDYLKR